jgi:hypothetical protein
MNPLTQRLLLALLFAGISSCSETPRSGVREPASATPAAAPATAPAPATAAASQAIARPDPREVGRALTGILNDASKAAAFTAITASRLEVKLVEECGEGPRTEKKDTLATEATRAGGH